MFFFSFPQVIAILTIIMEFIFSSDMKHELIAVLQTIVANIIVSLAICKHIKSRILLYIYIIVTIIELLAIII